MIRSILLVALVFGAGHCSTPTSTKESESKTLLVVEEFGGYGSQFRSFAVLYENGDLIREEQLQVPNQYPVYRISKIDRVPGWLVENGAEGLDKFAGRYELSAATDQGVTRIWYRGKCISIYGNWRKPLLLSEDPEDPDEIIKSANARARKMWGSLPGELREFCRRIAAYTLKDSREWHPSQIEVVLEKTNRSNGGAPVKWPEGWPKPSTSPTRQLANGWISFRIPYEHLNAACEIEDKMRYGYALLIDGQLYRMWLETPIPGMDAVKSDYSAAFGDRIY